MRERGPGESGRGRDTEPGYPASEAGAGAGAGAGGCCTTCWGGDPDTAPWFSTENGVLTCAGGGWPRPASKIFLNLNTTVEIQYF